MDDIIIPAASKTENLERLKKYVDGSRDQLNQMSIPKENVGFFSPEKIRGDLQSRKMLSNCRVSRVPPVISVNIFKNRFIFD